MNTPSNKMVGIDLGTTNSVVAALVDGEVRVLEEEGESILPSVVGMNLAGKLVVGHAAKNQLVAFPDRTISSVKRRMGEAVKLQMAGEEYTPQEISAIILRRLRQRAESVLGCEVTRAVITVPAYFDETQRQATREAGQLAGLTVERIINEPTAASVVYRPATTQPVHLIVYDLGGGTFDVSIVKLEGGIVEVLSSKGDTRLGGDDFDQLLAKHVAGLFLNRYGIDLMAESGTRWRLSQACERAKCELSYASVVRIAEEFIATVNGEPVNLEVDVSRPEYEQLIEPFVERTIRCVDDAIRDSGLRHVQLDELILVGGSTRTPLVQRRLQEVLQRDPQWCVSPDLAVALGAATQAAMQDGYSVGPILIDVATHTLGIEALQMELRGPSLKFCPIIRRNTPLPARYEELFTTVSKDQGAADIHVYQGESQELSQNQSIGQFLLEGLNATASSDGKILVNFELTLDGILKVTARESKSGICHTLNIHNALSQMEGDRVAAMERVTTMFEGSEGYQPLSFAPSLPEEDPSAESGHHAMDGTFRRVDGAHSHSPHLNQLIAKAREVRAIATPADVSDIERLLASIEAAQNTLDTAQLQQLESELDDLLFYLAD